MFHAAQARANLVSGGVATGSITAGGTSDQYFTGTSGQNVMLSVSASYSAWITIYKPDGTLWTSAQNRNNGVLPATGTFHVTIKGYYSTDSGSYSLYYVRATDSVSGGSLTSGLPVNTTQPLNGLTSYQFAGTSGDYFQTNIGATYSAWIYVFNPDGSIFANVQNRVAGALTQTGTYTVVIETYYTTDSGPYSLYFNIGAGSVSGGMLTSGLAVNAASQPKNALTSYQFTATSGQYFEVNVAASYSAWIYICNKDGSLFGANQNRMAGTLTQTGTFTVVIEGYYVTDTGPYDPLLTTLAPAASLTALSLIRFFETDR